MLASPWFALGLIWLAQVAVALGNAGLAVLGPFFISDLGVNHAQLGLLTTGLYAGSALMLVPASHLSDQLGPRNTFMLMVLVAGAPLLGLAAGVYHGRKRTAISECGEQPFRMKSYIDFG